MKAKKIIPTPVDVVGRNVSWKTDGGHTLYGEVVKVGFKIGPHPKYPNTQLRQLNKQLTIVMADGRVFKVSGEHDDLKRMGMVAETKAVEEDF